MQSNLVRNRQIEVRWVNRGGGCLMHSPGQLAIYPIVPLRWHGFSVGEFLHRFQTGIIEALDDLNVPSHACRNKGDGGGFADEVSRRSETAARKPPPSPSLASGAVPASWPPSAWPFATGSRTTARI